METPQRAAYRIKEASKMLGLSYRSVWKAIKRGDIPSFRLGKRVYVPKAFLERLQRGGE
ncbi:MULTISPECIES: helix-turn-helix domain-containing protein [unclassified Meiothermus]|uniref:helix-turn-helix domain-containing protein n=1 Tax=unclassified Meiothermus TaxID=370471 RepID=UPI000D7BE62E|nr:DNA-binding protein [Meiothermus sp. Pnk-1]RYM40654.1 DNA-binding protein [Meiothermus sp. PNK-Is4]